MTKFRVLVAFEVEDTSKVLADASVVHLLEEFYTTVDVPLPDWWVVHPDGTDNEGQEVFYGPPGGIAESKEDDDPADGFKAQLAEELQEAREDEKDPDVALWDHLTSADQEQVAASSPERELTFAEMFDLAERQAKERARRKLPK